MHDANVFKDPAAVSAVLQSSIPIVLTPLVLAPQLALLVRGDAHFARERRGGRLSVSRDARLVVVLDQISSASTAGSLSICCALLPALRNDLIVTQTRFAEFNAAGDLVVYPTRARGRQRVKFATEVRAKAKPFVLERLRRRPD